MRTAYATALVFAALLSGCSKVMSTPDIKQNPHPKQRYEITMIIDGAPGPFDSVTATMQFNIVNAADCAPQDPVSGAHPTAPYGPPVTWIQVTNNQYTATVYLDLAKDENYYGLGVCHWEFVAVKVGLNVHGASFSPDISQKDMISHASTTRYFSKDAYSDPNSKVRFDFGMPANNESYAVEHPDQFFKVVLSAKENAT